MIRIGPQQIKDLEEFVRVHSGILLDRVKPKGFTERIGPEILRCGIRRFEDYLFLLKSPSGKAARESLMSLISVGESSFFRNPAQFRFLAHELLPGLARAKREQGLDRITIWSAGCATGEEAYSIAYIARWFLQKHGEISIAITASDLSHQNIEKARGGMFRPRSFRAQAQEIIREFLLPLSREGGDGQVVEDSLRRMVDFRSLNLRDLDGLKSRQGTDIIFCRNVMIYFEDHFRDELLTTFHSLLPPGGILFLGETESLPQKCRLFELISCQGAYGYRKPLPAQGLNTAPKATRQGNTEAAS